MDLLQRFAPITLEEMSAVKLMNRIDTKFVTTRPMLERLLLMAESEYRIQEIGGKRNASYRTLYFDTPEADMFMVHQHGHANRQKLRFRTYVDSNLQFMEVKTKNNHGRTKKKRIAVSDTSLTDSVKLSFLSSHLGYEAATLSPAIENRFERITLVNSAKTERLTIDTGLRFSNVRTMQQRQLPQIVVIELKRDGLVASPVLAMLRQLRIHPHGFSKYCMGIAMTDQSLRINRFKPKLNDIERLLRQ